MYLTITVRISKEQYDYSGERHTAEALLELDENELWNVEYHMISPLVRTALRKFQAALEEGHGTDKI